jgi:TPR repeat protein
MTSRRNEYKEGLPIRWVTARAYRMLKYFAAEGDQEAQVALGSICRLGLGGLPIDEDAAVRWYTLASEKGSGLASNNLGTIAMLRVIATRRSSGTLRLGNRDFVIPPDCADETRIEVRRFLPSAPWLMET